MTTLTLAAAVANGWAFGPPALPPPVRGLSTAVSFPVIERLREIATGVGVVSGLLALLAVLVVTLDAISSGEKKQPQTTVGRYALRVAGILGLVVALVNAAHVVDVLRGHLFMAGGLPWRTRLPSVLNGLSALGLGAMVAVLSFVALGDANEVAHRNVLSEEGDFDGSVDDQDEP